MSTTKTETITITGRTLYEVEDKLRAEGISLKRIAEEPHRIKGTQVWIVKLDPEEEA